MANQLGVGSHDPSLSFSSHARTLTGNGRCELMNVALLSCFTSVLRISGSHTPSPLTLTILEPPPPQWPQTLGRHVMRMSQLAERSTAHALCTLTSCDHLTLGKDEAISIICATNNTAYVCQALLPCEADTVLLFSF